MAYRRALASGLQRLASHISSGSTVAQAITTNEVPAVSRVAPWAIQIARGFAAQPAAAPEAANAGKVTQVRCDEGVWVWGTPTLCENYS